MTDTAQKRPRGRPRKQGAEAEGGTVQALDRGLQILRLLARERRITLSHLAMQAGMPPSSAHRLLGTLQAHGFAEFDETTQDWMIGVEAFRTGAGFLQRINIVEASRAIMHGLMNATGETANLAIMDDDEVVFVSQVETHNPIRAFFRPGTRSAMHASGAGKALLAELSRTELERLLQRRGLREFTGRTLTRPDRLFEDLDRIRARGWSLDDEEHFDGMRCVAAPVFNAHGEAVAGISVSGPTNRFTDTRIVEISQTVRRAAAELTDRIGGTAPAGRG